MTLVIDVNLNTLKKITGINKVKQYFVVNKEDRYEIYVWFNNILYRNIYMKKNTEEDMLFFETTLVNSVFVDKITNLNEEAWQQMAIRINQNLEDISDKLDMILRKSGMNGNV